MAKIHVLDEHIANQIAAGEVVERPASVVKELVENAIDAKSTLIEVTVEEGGLQSIRVKDNGSGIEAEDCETAFYRHATSKISNGRDLFQITSLGFRGEALPSIAAVSKVTLLTASADDGKGKLVKIEGGKLICNEDAASPQGTDFEVRELFFNTPARLKYMKSIQTELGHISDAMYRMALAHPDISFRFHHNGNQLLHTLGNGDLLQVIAAVYGTSAAKAMLPISAEDPDYRISGYVSRPEWTRSNRNAVTTIVGGRYIRSNGLNASIMRAYHTLLPINRYPLLVLQLDMHPSLVDVNVHPAKLEVRFSKEVELYRFVEEEIRKVLVGQNLIPRPARETIGPKGSSSFIQEQFVFQKGSDKSTRSAGIGPTSQASHFSPNSTGTNSTNNTNNTNSTNSTNSTISTDNPNNLNSSPSSPSSPNSPNNLDSPNSPNNLVSPYNPNNPNSPNSPSTLNNSSPYNSNLNSQSFGKTAPQAASQIREASPNNRYSSPQFNPLPGREKTSGMDKLWAPPTGGESGLPAFPELNYIGQHHGTYIIAQNDEGLYLIDQHAAHERINYEYYYEKFGRPVDASQELLLPITLEFTPSESQQLSERLHWFEQAGVILEHFGGQTFLVRSLPYWFPQGEEQTIIEEMAEWVLSERTIDLAKLREKSSILCSCKASIKANHNLTEQEVDSLLNRLSDCRQPYTCPHGRPIIISFSGYDLEKLFKRVM